MISVGNQQQIAAARIFGSRKSLSVPQNGKPEKSTLQSSTGDTCMSANFCVRMSQYVLAL